MKKLLLALALFIIPSLAWAQNVQCADRPVGDSSNACANTRFVSGTSITGVGTIASAATTDVGTKQQMTLLVSGNATINSFGTTTPLLPRVLIFSGTPTLTYNATSLILPGAADIVVAPNDSAIIAPLGSGNWQVVSYQRAATTADVQLVGATIFGAFGSTPTKYVRGTGQALSRATYPDYLAAVTKTQTGAKTSGNATISSVSDTTAFGAGMPVEGTDINAGCTIASVTSSTVVLNSSSCVIGTGTSNFTVFLTGYGSGGNSSTVGVMDCQNRSVAGVDYTGVARLTTAGSGVNGAAANATGGAQTHTMTLAELVSHTHTASATSPPHSHATYNSASGGMNAIATAGTGATGGGVVGQFTDLSGLSTTGTTVTVSVTNSATGSSTPFPIVQPTIIAPCLVRVFN